MHWTFTREASEDLVQKQHPDWTNYTQIKEEAEKQFNAAGRLFFELTLNKVRELRPGGKWGYYGFPNCYGQYVGQYCVPGAYKRTAICWTGSAMQAQHSIPALSLITNRVYKHTCHWPPFYSSYILWMYRLLSYSFGQQQHFILWWPPYMKPRAADKQPPWQSIPTVNNNYEGAPDGYYYSLVR